MGRIKLPSVETTVRIIVGGSAVNAAWWGLAKLVSIESLVRDWGFLALSVVVVIVVGWYLRKRIPATHLAEENTNVIDFGSTTQHNQELTQEHIVERLSFIQQLWATEEQLVKNVHFNIPESVAHYFTKFCEESDVRTIVQQDNMATTAVRLITERFHNLTSQCLEHQERGKKLTASTITDDNIRNECNKMSQAVREYRRMVDEWMKFTEDLVEKGVSRFWEKPPWSVNVHKKLADDYDELMRLVKNLRNATPRAFQDLLPKDNQVTKFPRRPLSG